MAIPAYMWLKDDQGNEISGSVQVTGRTGSVEILEYSHNIYIPTDSDTGDLTGTRKHSAITVVKTFDASSPYLFKACCNGQKLQQAIIRWYNINDAGQEQEYYEHVLEGVKISSYSPGMANTKNPAMEKIPHIEQIALRYEKLTHTFLDGNISYSDSWIEGR
ncbi:MAG: type VI secretion system tube protein Hcp [Candidatus Thiodiazotropha sp. (ex Monitilora ramsayi)]|nr:type VI secretion system tube protein Hcp [Candidatus Thiodiazotropha sp. (ex Monitilora ramsayi)]